MNIPFFSPHCARRNCRYPVQRCDAPERLSLPTAAADPGGTGLLPDLRR